MPQDSNDRNEPNGQQQDAGNITDLSAWLQAQPDEVRGAFEAHTRALKNALAAEREQRKTLDRQLREAASKLEKDSEARAALEAQVAKLQELERQSAFYDAAHAAGCVNLRLAYLAASDAGLVRDDGTADWESIRRRYPELFNRAVAAGDAKVGAGHEKPPETADMNAYIRRAAGRA